MVKLICKECGSDRKIGRKLCTPCNSKRSMSYGYYLKTNNCLACKCAFKAWRKDRKLCGDCYSLCLKLSSENASSNIYIWSKIGGMAEHRYVAEQILGRKLLSNEVVHHVNTYTKDNHPENLMVMSIGDHVLLHKFLDLQRVIWEKSQNENHGNCWNPLIAPITTTWLETTGVKVIKIWEIGQSAAEPLKQQCNEEGSETERVTS